MSFFDDLREKLARLNKKYPTATGAATSGQGGFLGIAQGLFQDLLPGESPQSGPNQVNPRPMGVPMGLVILGAGAIVLILVLKRRK